MRLLRATLATILGQFLSIKRPASCIRQRENQMKTLLLPILSVSLWLIVADHRSEAAPGPAHLSEVATLEVGGPSQSLTFSPDGKILFAVVGSPFSKARSGIWLWDVSSRKHIATLEPDPEMHCVFSWIVLSPDGQTAA